MLKIWWITNFSDYRKVRIHHATYSPNPLGLYGYYNFPEIYSFVFCFSLIYHDTCLNFPERTFSLWKLLHLLQQLVETEPLVGQFENLWEINWALKQWTQSISILKCWIELSQPPKESETTSPRLLWLWKTI